MIEFISLKTADSGRSATPTYGFTNSIWAAQKGLDVMRQSKDIKLGMYGKNAGGVGG